MTGYMDGVTLQRYLSLLLAAVSLSAATEAPILPSGELRDEFARYLTTEAEKHWRARSAKVAALRSPAQVEERQRYIRRTLLEAIGGFPAKTPLNARITGGFTRNGYRVEHLIFESQPKFFVTANVYVPTDAKPPFPAILGVAGHSATGKAIATYQQAWIGMVKRGFLVVAFDPPGQGERSEYFDAALGKSSVGIGTGEHNMAGPQTLLTGGTLARYEVWDGIRAFDYLLTRKDVDPKRIGVAGNSGGGTQSAYLAVFEPRLAACVISCYMTDWAKLWTKPGPQDAEQNFPGFLSAGLNFGDFMIAFAPKPVTMLTGIRDYFPIEGARDTYAEAKRVFEVLDAPGRAGYFEYDDEHGWHKPRREATYRWLTKFLQGKEDDSSEAVIEPEPENLLNATPTGQVSTSFGGETVQSLNLKIAEKLFAGRTAAHIAEPEKLRAVVARRLRMPARAGVPKVTAVRPDSLLIESEPGIRIPARLFVPSGPGKHPAMIYVNSGGKSANPAHIESLRHRGYVVLAIDPRGWGESGPGNESGGSSASRLAQRAMLIGKPLAGMQVYDVLASFDYLVSRQDVDPSRVGIRGFGSGGVIALLAGALEPAVATITSEGAVASYMAIARAKTHAGLTDIIVPGVLSDFDLPDIAGLIAPRSLHIASARTANGLPLDDGELQREYSPAAKKYEHAKRAEALKIGNVTPQD
jgi:cephalosporin-C deacetylase-like acetyl esterase